MALGPETPDDIVSGRAIIIDRFGRYLLGLRPEGSNHHGGKWELFGGKFDPRHDRTTTDAARREGTEETGLILMPDHSLPAEISLMHRPKWPAPDGTPVDGTYRSYAHHMQVFGNPRITQLKEHQAYHWSLPDQALALPNLSYESRVAIYQSMLARQALEHSASLVTT